MLLFAAASAWGGPGPPEIVAENDLFVNPNPAIVEGGTLLFDNNDGHTHNVTADDNGPDGKPFFRSGNVAGGLQNQLVDGTEFLDAGAYPFHCTIHPDTMSGTLTVNPSGSGPVPRPSIALKIKSKKLAKVVKKKKLKVEVSASQPTDAEGVSLQASKGRKSITKTLEFDLASGATETEKLKLKKSAAKNLADLEKAKVKVTGTVDFGSGDKASKKLK